MVRRSSPAMARKTVKKPDTTAADTQAAREHLERGEPQKAMALLAPMARRLPNSLEVLGLLINACHDAGDLLGYEEACRKLLGRVPDHPEVYLMLAGAHLHNHRPAMGCLVFSRFLERYPQHERAGEAREALDRLSEPLQRYLSDLGFTSIEALQLAALHEDSNAHLERGELREARRLSERLLKSKPDCVPALNNLSQLYWMEGMADKAVAAAQRVLILHDDNYHALSNLARFHFLSGREGDARAHAERLMAITEGTPDLWVKQAEAMAFLGDDEAVLQAFERGREQGSAMSRAVLHHLAAVAHARRGDQPAALGLWKRALELDPDLDLARQNVDDMHQPAEDRLGPFAVGLGGWLSEEAMRDLDTVIDASRSRGFSAAGPAVRNYLERHPEVLALMQHLVDRGDPVARELAVRLAAASRTPECRAVLQRFLESSRGPRDLREEARRALS